MEEGFNEMQVWVEIGDCCLLVKCTVLWWYGSAQPAGWYGKDIGKETMEKLRTNEKPLASRSNKLNLEKPD